MLAVWFSLGLLGSLVLFHLFRALTRSKFSAPSRITWKGSILNWLLWPEALMKRKPAFKKITLAALKKAATKNAKGLNDFGDTWFETAYAHAADMVNGRNLSSLGKYISFDSMMRRLVARLRVQDELKRSPGALARPLVPPVFVLGLPRTGTTFLHHLLSLDDAVRCPQTWELFDPTPQKADQVADRKSRIKYVQNGIEELKSIVPHIEAIHEIGATEPEECFVSMGMVRSCLLRLYFMCSLYFKTPRTCPLSSRRCQSTWSTRICSGSGTSPSLMRTTIRCDEYI